MKLVVLDRDGVINQDRRDYVKSLDEWQPIEGSLRAIARLNKAGFVVTIATNQSGVAKKCYDLAMLNAIHDNMQKQLQQYGGHIDKIYFCPHHWQDCCNCRKPKPGMLQQMAKDFAVDWAHSYAIGDARRDISAAKQMGCQALLVRTGKGKTTIRRYANVLKDVLKFDDLAATVDYILGCLSK